jgi:hypothetical protein
MQEQMMALGTKEEIMREYGMLAYVPGRIANSAMCGVWALRQVRGWAWRTWMAWSWRRERSV